MDKLVKYDETNLTQISVSIVKMQENLTEFTSGMVSCYSECDASDLPEFKNLRYAVVEDA